MTRRHLILLQVGVGGLVLSTILRTLSPGPGRVPACAEPHLVVREGRELLRCTGRAAQPRLSGAQRLLLGVPIDVNQATVTDLEALPRIGPALARRIVEDRRARGSFRSVVELDRVKGIGPATVRRLHGLVCATATADPGAAGR